VAKESGRKCRLTALYPPMHPVPKQDFVIMSIVSYVCTYLLAYLDLVPTLRIAR